MLIFTSYPTINAPNGDFKYLPKVDMYCNYKGIRVLGALFMVHKM